ncbi:Glucose starvation modulator protein 1 [Candida viswanathii]|uniref:Glucose starvation modulator protein 1 n=1 Tax=Candida viswanathii TaxID=5486 RepID=A0A367XQZ9_9ASCO|nr:Glucose starvation modulator protein 1 [Candida viswanathii]
MTKKLTPQENKTESLQFGHASSATKNTYSAPTSGRARTVSSATSAMRFCHQAKDYPQEETKKHPISSTGASAAPSTSPLPIDVALKQDFQTPTDIPLQIKDILEVPPHISNMMNSSALNTNVSLTPETLMVPDSLQFHTTTMLNTTNDVLNKLLTDQFETESMISANNSTNQNNKPPQQHQFSSTYLNDEYLMLGDILLHSKPVSPSPSNTSASEYNTNTLSPTNFGFLQNVNFEGFNQPKRRSPRIEKEPGQWNPIINFGTKYVTDYVSPLITNGLYQSVKDIYSYQIINYEYPDSYHALTKFLKERFGGNDLSIDERKEKRSKLLVILKLIASYRPTFIAATKIIRYFKFFKNIAVNDLQSLIAIKVKLINKDGNLIEFCSVYTIKRDIFDIPMLIVGQFLPIM